MKSFTRTRIAPRKVLKVSQDILPLLLSQFRFKLFFGFANVIEPFVDRTFGYNFDASAPWDRSFIDSVHQRDEAEIFSGRIKPTHMLAVMSSHPVVTPMIFRAPLTPQFCLRDPALRPVAAASPDGSRPDAYDWHSWPHSPQREVEIACERLKKAEEVWSRAIRESSGHGPKRRIP